MRLAVIFESSPFDRKGMFNAAHNRIRHLLKSGKCVVDAYCIHSWDTPFTRKVRHTPYISEKVDHVVVDGISYRMLWYDFSIMDHITVEKLKMRPVQFSRFIDRTASLLKDYDAVIAHSFAGGLVAYDFHKKYGKPFYITWHGSDIHTHAVRNNLIGADTRKLMEAASCNFFVSRALMHQSDNITVDARKEVLYNGVSEAFVRLDDSRRKTLRDGYGLSDDEKVVAFVGSLVSVKNVNSLRPIFHEVRRRYEGPLKFLLVGDGKKRDEVVPQLLEDEALDVQFLGNVLSDDMPSVMNCIDVMVLPSLNEGLPLVCAEAVRCGVSVVGSDVGGVAEVIGRESVVSLEPAETFPARFAEKVVERLGKPVCHELPSELSWEATAAKELFLMGVSE